MLKTFMHINYILTRKRFLVFNSLQKYQCTHNHSFLNYFHISDTEANLDVCKFLNYFVQMF